MFVILFVDCVQKFMQYGKILYNDLNCFLFIYKLNYFYLFAFILYIYILIINLLTKRYLN